ncbi:MAG: pyridoxal-phosphate dependent enzyme [Bacteroidota bacterium]
MFPTPEIIEAAHRRIHPYMHRTPLLTSRAINEMTGAELVFKCENFQKAGAFKFRGATNTVFSLSEGEMQNGVATHSSGNHAAALALAASLRGINAYIVMPSNSSKVKIAAVELYKGVITFCEPSLQAREDTLAEVLLRTNAIEIHPYNDYRIIAGQATAAKELIEEGGQFDIIMAPVGGGGLLSGTALSVHYFSPYTRVIASEPMQADDAYQSFYQKRFVPSINPNTIADGLRTSLGTLTYPIIQEYVHQIVRVSEEAIVWAMRIIWERMKIIIEPSSAVPLAALLENAFEHKDLRIGIILSGGNVDLDELPFAKK